MICLYVNILQYFQKFFCYHFHSQELSLFLRWSYCRWTLQQWTQLPSASTTQYGFHQNWKQITRCISPMSFGIIFEVFGDKKLEVRWLLSWYVTVWTFLRTRCSLGHNKKAINFSVHVSRNDPLMNLFLLVYVQYCQSSLSGEVLMLKIRWGRFILRVSNHTNIFWIKPKGLQKCREVKAVSIYDAGAREDFRFQYINEKQSLSKASTISI